MDFKLQAPFIQPATSPKRFTTCGWRSQGMKNQVLLGATGTAKRYCCICYPRIANAALIMGAYKTLAAQLYAESKSSSLKCGRVFCFLL